MGFNQKKKKYKHSELITLIREKINQIKTFSNAEIKNQSLNLQQTKFLVCDEKPLIDSFAYFTEITNRYLGVNLYDTQLLGGLLLNSGTIVEMKTGEGKSFVASLASYFKALDKKGVHIVTVNEYLAERDWQKMTGLYNFLGIQVGLIKEEMEIVDKQFNYNCDITYLTNSSLGFDYLRDNLVTKTTQIVQRPFHFGIVDEVDSILIDEALTPLIISGRGNSINDEKYIQAAFLVQYLNVKQHFLINQKKKDCFLTDEGSQLCAKLLDSSSLYDSEDAWIPYIVNALRAKMFYIKNKNYILQKNQVIIIDEFTGRLLYGRQWSEGLQQSIQAKENVTITPPTQTYASITYQNLFLLYPSGLSGMTGTASTAKLEFEKIYALKVNVLPTSRKLQRIDLKDLVFIDEFTKWLTIVKVCQENYMRGRPVLVGTTNVGSSQLLSSLLKKAHIRHKLLNAEASNARFEGDIISQAGLPQSITIATNMAGRGADIILGGNYLNFVKLKIKRLLYPHQITSFLKKYRKNVRVTFLNKEQKFNLLLFLFSEFNTHYILNQFICSVKSFDPSYIFLTKKLKTNLIKYYIQKYKIITKRAARLVKLRGGLFVIGTERHDSVRIDNQLRGRSGRQGDKGLTRFILSFDDKLLKIFGNNPLRMFMQQFSFGSNKLNVRFEATALTKAIDMVQKKVENFSYDSRNKLFKSNEIANNQRASIFAERTKFVHGINLKDRLVAYIQFSITDFAQSAFAQSKDLTVLKTESGLLGDLFKSNPLLIEYLLRNKNLTFDVLQESFYSLLWQNYEVKESEIEIYFPGILRCLEKTILLNNIDNQWKIHLQKMDSLKDSVAWRAYGQKDPLIEYKAESYNLFLWTIREIHQGVTSQFFNFDLK